MSYQERTGEAKVTLMAVPHPGKLRIIRVADLLTTQLSLIFCPIALLHQLQYIHQPACILVMELELPVAYKGKFPHPIKFLPLSAAYTVAAERARFPCHVTSPKKKYNLVSDLTPI